MLDDAARAAARVVSVLDGRATVADVAELTGLTTAETEAALAALDRAGLLADEPALRLLVVPEPVEGYAERQLCGRAARLLRHRGASASELVALLVRSPPLGEAWAAGVLRDGAAEEVETALASGSSPEHLVAHLRTAVALAERGLAERPDPAVRTELDLLRLRGLAGVGADLTDEGPRVLDALEARGAHVAVAEGRLLLVETLSHAGDPRATHHALRLPDEAARVPDPAWRTRALAVYLSATYVDAALAVSRAAVLDANRDLLADGPLAAAAAAAYAEAGRDDEADAMLARVPDAGFVSEPERLVELGLVGVAHVHLERLAEAEETFGRVMASAPAHVRLNARAWKALIDVWAGRLEGVAAAEELLASPLLWPVLRPIAWTAVLEGALLTASDAELTALLERCRPDVETPLIPRGPGVGALLVAVARVSLALGLDGEPLLARAEAAYPSADWLAPWPLVRPDTTNHEWLTRWADGRRPLTRAWASAVLGRPVDVDDLPRPLRARLLLRMGADLRRAGRLREARPVLRAAERTARGFARVEAETARELRLAGGRLRRTDVHGLTPAEVEVAALAAAGRTNREIAAALRVSQKTVESHMSRVLGKTGRRREALRELLAASPQDEQVS